MGGFGNGKKRTLSLANLANSKKADADLPVASFADYNRILEELSKAGNAMKLFQEGNASINRNGRRSLRRTSSYKRRTSSCKLKT